MKPIDRLGFGPRREAVFDEAAGMWLVTVTPPSFTEFKPSTISLTEDQYERYRMWHEHGGLIQHMLPELSNAAREILISGINSEEWDNEFGDLGHD